MRVENGKLILEKRKCSCNDGIVTYYDACPNNYKVVRGKYPGNKCPHCGAKNKWDHKSIGSHEETCPRCNGAAILDESRYDSIPDELWQSLTFKVYRSNRRASWAEQWLGLGCYSTVDYGAYKKLTDAEIIAKNREHHYIQACKVCNKDLIMCDHIGIFCHDQGYSVVAIMEGGETV